MSSLIELVRCWLHHHTMNIYRGGKERKKERVVKEGEIRQQNHELQNFIMCRAAHSHTKQTNLKKKYILRQSKPSEESEREKKENECISKFNNGQGVDFLLNTNFNFFKLKILQALDVADPVNAAKECVR